MRDATPIFVKMFDRCRATVRSLRWRPAAILFKVVGAHVPPPAGVPSPLAWGTEDRLAELLGTGASVEAVRRHFVFRFRSAEDFYESFRQWYGPVERAWATLDDAGRASLREGLVGLAEAHNRGRGGALAVSGEYLEVVAVKP